MKQAVNAAAVSAPAVSTGEPAPATAPVCPMDAILRLLMGPWTTYILWILRNEGPTRFGALKRKVGGISAKILTERLRLLEQAGVIERHYNPTIPPQVTYSLSRRGAELSPILDQLDAVARRWSAEDRRPPAVRAAE